MCVCVSTHTHTHIPTNLSNISLVVSSLSAITFCDDLKCFSVVNEFPPCQEGVKCTRSDETCSRYLLGEECHISTYWCKRRCGSLFLPRWSQSHQNQELRPSWLWGCAGSCWSRLWRVWWPVWWDSSAETSSDGNQYHQHIKTYSSMTVIKLCCWSTHELTEAATLWPLPPLLPQGCCKDSPGCPFKTKLWFSCVGATKVDQGMPHLSLKDKSKLP